MSAESEAQIARTALPGSPLLPAPATQSTVARTCQNCDAGLTGRYCGACGQRAIRIDVSILKLVREGLTELFDVDGRILVTLRYLFTQPGRLSADMIAGKRRRYISPIRLYLVSSVIFFLALTRLVTVPVIDADAQKELDRVHFSDREFDKNFGGTIKAGVVKVLRDPKAFMAAVWENAPTAAFAMMPVFGFLTMLAFRKRLRFFVPHFYFALHFHSFVFLFLPAVLALAKVVDEDIFFFGSLVIFAYLVAAARRAFAGGWWEATWKSALISSFYFVLLGLTIAATFVFSFFRI